MRDSLRREMSQYSVTLSVEECLDCGTLSVEKCLNSVTLSVEECLDCGTLSVKEYFSCGRLPRERSRHLDYLWGDVSPVRDRDTCMRGAALP